MLLKCRLNERITFIYTGGKVVTGMFLNAYVPVTSPD